MTTPKLPTHYAEVFDVSFRTYDYQAKWNIEVRRLPAHILSAETTPNVNDVPKDIRDALLKWLQGAGDDLGTSDPNPTEVERALNRCNDCGIPLAQYVGPACPRHEARRNRDIRR